MKRKWELMLIVILTFVMLTMYMIWSLPDPFKSDSQEQMFAKQKGMIKIATYNIWNFMFHWDVRKLYIAKYITREYPDVIAFQEVREGEKEGNQLDHLQALIPDYAHKVFYVATPQTDTGMKEGLGLLSRHPINILQQLHSLDMSNQCHIVAANYIATHSIVIPTKDYRDLWSLLHPDSPKEDGYTFSNMPWPGKQSRPDRILMGDSQGCLNPLNIKHDANGTEYEALYWKQVYLDRLWPVLTSAKFLMPIPVCIGISWKFPRSVGLLSVLGYFVVILHYAKKDLMKEEFFSSDHDILIATLQPTC